MASIFISHSSRNSDQAIQVRDWLAANGWQDVFLDLDPERGIVAGQRWKEALQKAAYRCEVVLALVSTEWLVSGWCKSEIDAARLMGKKIIVALIGIGKDQVPQDLADEQWVDLVGDPAGYRRLKEGLKRAGLDPSSFALAPGRRPYPGFAFLEEEDAALFFGRDAQIVRALDKMRGIVRVGVDRMLVILGASGSGKSSFLRAGLLPRLARDDRTWLPLPVIRPERAVISGNFGLAQALQRAMNAGPFVDQIRKRHLPRSRAEIHEFVTTREGGLLEIFAALREIGRVPGLSGENTQPPSIVIAVDQGEELFNEEGRDEARRFIEILSGTLKADPGAVALVAMRSDAFPQLQNEADLADLPKDTFTLDMMLQGSYRAVIEGPARLVEPPLRIDPQLVDALLEDVSGQDALPLLAFTLAHLYERYSADNELSLAGYEKLGRLKGVIDTTIGEAFAEGVTRGQLPKDAKAQLALARSAFIPHLAQVNDAGQFVRRVATYAEISVEARAVIDCFAERRLLIKDRRNIAGTDVEVIEVAHEAVLRQPPISEWLVEDREFLVWRERLGQARTAFEANERGLLAGRELQIARDWVQRRAKGEIPPRDQAFVDESVAEDRRQRAAEAERELQRHAAELEAAQARELAARETASAARRVAQRTRAGLIVAVFLLAIAVGAGGYAWQSEKEAVVARDDALLNQSRLLAARAQQETDEGDHAMGILLALEALPDATSDQAIIRRRPYWAPAGVILENARRALREKVLLTGHGGSISGVAMMPDGERILTGSSDKTARIWRAQTGAELVRLEHTAAVTGVAVAVTPHGERIITGARDGVVRIWNPETRTALSQFKDPSGDPVTAVAATADGTRIIAGYQDRRVRVWDAASGVMLFEGKEHLAAINALAATPDGSRIVTVSEDQTALIWEGQTGNVLRKLKEGSPINSVTISSDGARIVTGSRYGTARIWNARTGAAKAELKGHQASVTAVAMSPDGTRIVTGSDDRTTRIWDAETGMELARLRGPQNRVTAVAVTLDGAGIVTGASDWTVRISAARLGLELTPPKGQETKILGVSAMPDQARIVTLDEKTIRTWDARTGAQYPTLVQWNPSGEATVAFDGGIIVTQSKDGTGRVWDGNTGSKVSDLKGADAAVAAVTSDGGRIVTGSKNGTPRIWDARAGVELLQFKGEKTIITAMAVTLDGTRIVTGSTDWIARTWDARTGHELSQLKGHRDRIRSVAVTGDGALIVTGSDDGTARIWDARTASS